MNRALIVIFLALSIGSYSQDSLRLANKKQSRIFTLGVTINSMVYKEASYSSYYVSKNPDGYEQNVIITPKNTFGFGINFGTYKKIASRKNFQLLLGIENAFSFYHEKLEKIGYESDISFSLGKIKQDTKILNWQFYGNLIFENKLKKDFFIDLNIGLGFNSPILSYGYKSYESNSQNQSNTVKWGYSMLGFFLSCPLKIEVCKKIHNKIFGVGLGTQINDTYVIPASKQLEFDNPTRAQRDEHNIGFNTFSYGSYKTYNNPTKAFIINLSFNVKL